MHNLEAEVKDAIGWEQPQVQPEAEQPQQPEVTIYDFAALMKWSDDPNPNTQPST
jgi:hypothetical protein